MLTVEAPRLDVTFLGPAETYWVEDKPRSRRDAAHASTKICACRGIVPAVPRPEAPHGSWAAFPGSGW